MTQKLGTTLILIVYISATTHGYGVPRAWTPMNPPFHQYGTYDDVEVDEPFDSPRQVTRRPVQNTVGMQPLVTSPSPVQEYPVSPRKYLSRIIVSQSTSNGDSDVHQKLTEFGPDKRQDNPGNEDTVNDNDQVSFDELKNAAPIQNSEDLKETMLERVQIPPEGMGETEMEKAQLPMANLFNMFRGTKQNVTDDDVELKDALTRIIVNTLEKMQDMQILDKIELPLQIGNELIKRPIRQIEDALIGVPAEKLEDMKNALINVPVDKMESMKDALINVPAEKMESMKEALLNVPVDKMESMKDALMNVPAEKMGAMKDALMNVPVDKMESMKDALMNVSTEKMGAMKDALMNVPTEKMESMKEALLNVPVDKMESMKDALMNVPAEKMGAMKDALMNVPVDKMESMKDALMNVSTEKMGAMKDALMNVPADKMESMKDALMNVPNEKMESMKEALINVPNEKMESMKEALLNVPTDKMESMKDALLNVPAEKMGAMKDALMNVPSDKMESMKEALMNVPVDKMESMKEALLNVPVDKMESMKEALMNVPVDKMESMKEALLNVPADKMESMKDALMNVPVEKMGAMKDALMNVPVDKMESMKEALLNVPVDKMESMKEALLNVPAEKMGAMKDALMNVPADKMEAMKDALIGVPNENMEAIKNVLIGVPADKMEAVKNALIGIPTEPTGNMEGIKDAAVGTVIPMGKFQDMKVVIGEPISKIGNVDGGIMSLLKSRLEDMTGAVISGSSEKIQDMQEGVMGAPAEKLQEIKDSFSGQIQNAVPVPVEKDGGGGISMGFPLVHKLDDFKEIPLQNGMDSSIPQIPMEKNADLKYIASSKVDGDVKEMELNPAIPKPDNSFGFTEDLKDIVFTAFTQSIKGDRKEYFKSAIGKMNKEELDDLHDALISVLNMKELSASPIQNIGHVIELKNAVHELVLSESTNKKESFSELEKVLDEVNDPAEKESGSRAVINEDSMLASSSKMVSTTTENSQIEDEDIYDFRKLNGMENMRRRRRWGMGQNARFNPAMFHQRSRNSGGGWGRRKRSIYGVGTTAQEIRNFFPPAGLRIPMRTAFRQINSAAPPDPYPRSKESLSLPLLSINEVATDKIMMDIKEGLKYVLQTKNDFTLAIHGSATTGCHAVLDNLIEGGDKVLVLINGYWSELMANMSERLGAQVVRYNKPPGTVFTLDEIRTALRVHRPDIVLVVQGESSTTVRQPLEGVGDLCEKHNALLVVDVVAVAGMQPVLMDKYKMDAVFTSSNKGLGGVCGLAPISLSPRAVQKMKTRLTPPRAYQTDLTLQAELWNTTNPDRTRFQSMSLPLFYSLREALATIVEERIENTFKRHELTSEHLNRGLTSLGLENFVEDSEHRLIGITAVKVPFGKDAKKVANYMFKNYNIEISSGFGPTAGKVLRMAIFASNADTYRTSNVLRALKNALNARETNNSY